MRVLKGTFDQSDFIRFPKYFGRQCSANAVAAVCKAHVLNPNLWTSMNVDECLMAGNKLFELSYELLPSTYRNIIYLRPDELHSYVTFPENEIKFEVQVNDEYYGTSMNNIATVNHGIVNYCIDDAVLCFLHSFKYGIFTCKLQCVAIMKISNDYFIFDSHKRGKDRLTDCQNGTAVLLRFNDIHALVLHLKSLFKCTTCSSTATVHCATCQFTIIPLLISAVTNSSTNALIDSSKTDNESTEAMSEPQLARNAKKNKSCTKNLQKTNLISNIQKKNVNLEAIPASTADLVYKIYDLRIRSTDIKYERTDEMKVKNIQQISNRYKTNAEVRETKRKQQRDKIKEKYHGDETFQKSHSSNMREKYQTNVEYHNNTLQNTKNSYQTLQGAKRKSNYQNQYHSSKKTKICLHERFNEQKREMPTVICTCCAQLFFKKSTVNELGLKIHQTLSVADVCTYRHHLGENESGNVCSTCANHLKKGKVPHFAAKNGLVFDPLPQELTGLTTLEERLVSARIPFMQIRELGYQRQLGLKGNCVNVPIDINKTVTCLPRMDSEDDTLLVQLMRRMSDKTPYAFENVRPEKVFNAARYLVNTDLYKQHNITLNESWLQQFHDETNNSANDSISSSNTNDSTEQADEIDELMDQQETLLTSGFVADSGVKIAPGEGNMPLSLTLDEDMDVLAFPTVYGGKQRIFKVKYTPVEMAKAEARHHDRRVAINIPKNRVTVQRFNYPLPPMRERKILLPLSNDIDEQEKLKAKKIWSEIKEQTEVIAKNHEDCSFDEYLAYLNVDEQSYIQALRSKLKRPTVFLGRNLNERRVNAYNKEMLILWEAHMDIQLVVSPYGCVKYIVSYVSKSQKGMSKLLKEVADKVAKGDEPTIKKLRKIVNAFLNNCEISAQEIALHVLGIPMSKSSIGTIYINSCPPDQRVFLKKGKKELEKICETDPNSTDIQETGMIEHYIERPDILESTCLADFAALYKYSKTHPHKKNVSTDETEIDLEINDDEIIAEKNCDDESNKKAVYELKNNSGFLTKRNKRLVIQFRNYKEGEDKLNFQRENLMLFTSWRTEPSLLDSDLPIKFSEKLEVIQRNRGNYCKYDSVFDNIEVDLLEEDEENEEESTVASKHHKSRWNNRKKLDSDSKNM
ncbi:putative membrane protein P31B10.04 [Frankliniella fusca]|uniref:Membrane protein P31B10.04 n=1 Tax=Frankliniella fusca TaxID=407009 RepID=A0AAE1GR73_9NEOP|nr:putative membrane protein P31B10.04 [Frankliniella fusca]